MCGDSQDVRAKTFSLSDTDVLFIIYLMNRTWEKQVVNPPSLTVLFPLKTLIIVSVYEIANQYRFVPTCVSTTW